jgi:hypothetical protein
MLGYENNPEQMDDENEIKQVLYDDLEKNPGILINGLKDLFSSIEKVISSN